MSPIVAAVGADASIAIARRAALHHAARRRARMRARGLRAGACVLAALRGGRAAPPRRPDLSMSRDAVVSTRLGDELRLPARVANTGRRRSRASSRTSTSSASTRASTSIPRTGRRSAPATCAPLPPGALDAVAWTVKAVNGGRLRDLRRRPGRRPAGRGPGPRRARLRAGTLDAGGVLPLAARAPRADRGARCWASGRGGRASGDQRTGLTWLISAWFCSRNCSSYCGRTSRSTGVISLLLALEVGARRSAPPRAGAR